MCKECGCGLSNPKAPGFGKGAKGKDKKAPAKKAPAKKK
jgi:hypothetical protein